MAINWIRPFGYTGLSYSDFAISRTMPVAFCCFYQDPLKSVRVASTNKQNLTSGKGQVYKKLDLLPNPIYVKHILTKLTKSEISYIS